MFNNRQTGITTSQTFVDEFDTVTATESVTPVGTATIEHDREAVEFNSRISQNMDKIIHYDTYATRDRVVEDSRVYRSVSEGVNLDVRPSSTTMQFQGMHRSEIYRDVKEETQVYPSQTKVAQKSKLLLFFTAAVVVMLSVLIVFNTMLLKSMNKVLEEKQTVVEALLEENNKAQSVLDEVSSEDRIIEEAIKNGMVKADK